MSMFNLPTFSNYVYTFIQAWCQWFEACTAAQATLIEALHACWSYLVPGESWYATHSCNVNDRVLDHDP
jgi:hypothetical protein